MKRALRKKEAKTQWDLLARAKQLPKPAAAGGPALALQGFLCFVDRQIACV